MIGQQASLTLKVLVVAEPDQHRDCTSHWPVTHPYAVWPPPQGSESIGKGTWHGLGANACLAEKNLNSLEPVSSRNHKKERGPGWTQRRPVPILCPFPGTSASTSSAPGDAEFYSDTAMEAALRQLCIAVSASPTDRNIARLLSALQIVKTPRAECKTLVTIANVFRSLSGAPETATDSSN